MDAMVSHRGPPGSYQLLHSDHTTEVSIQTRTYISYYRGNTAHSYVIFAGRLCSKHIRSMKIVCYIRILYGVI